MNNDYILVHKSILPEYYERVIKARDMIEGENRSITSVCKALNISRSTYYKYKDYIFYPDKNVLKKAYISFKVDDIPGVLSSILSVVNSYNINVLTINQEMPIHSLAFITLMVNTENISVSLDEILEKLRTIKEVKSVEVLNNE